MPEFYGANAGSEGLNGGVDRRAAPPTKPRPKSNSIGANAPPAVARKPKPPVAAPGQPAVRNGAPSTQPAEMSALGSPMPKSPGLSSTREHKARPPPPARNQSLAPEAEVETAPVPAKPAVPKPARKPDVMAPPPTATAKPDVVAPPPTVTAKPRPVIPRPEKHSRAPVPEPVIAKTRPVVQHKAPPPVKPKSQSQPLPLPTDADSNDQEGQVDDVLYNEIEDLISNFYDELETSDFFFKAQLENQ